MSLVGVGRGKVQPDFSLDPVLRHAKAFVVKKAEQELRGRLALFGRLMEPTGGDDIVARQAETILAHVAEIGLRSATIRARRPQAEAEQPERSPSEQKLAFPRQVRPPLQSRSCRREPKGGKQRHR